MNTACNRNPAQPESTDQNIESGQEVAKQNMLGHSEKRTHEGSRSLSRSHAKYWEARLFRPFYTRNGKRHEVNDLAVRIQHGGRREIFPLHTTNRAKAAESARTTYGFLKVNGWDATLAKFKPDSEPQLKLNITVGDFLQTVRESVVPTPLKLRTFLNYQNCLRTIASEIFSVKGGKARFDYRTGGNAEWVRKINSVRLERLTPERVNEWKKTRLLQAGNSPAAISSAKRTINSYIRCSRSLFSPSLLKLVKGIELPSVLPFEGVELEENGNMKYISRVNARALIAAARAELKPTKAEAYKVFLLALFAGMRKAEIDYAEWDMIDFDACVMNLQETEWLHLKTQDSADEITVDAEVIDELRELMPKPGAARGHSDRFIIASARPPRNDTTRAYYRCEPVFEEVNAWLRGKGISTNKPLHELRKEVGALIATEHGIYAASRFLRHSDITTTARHYADQKKRISVGLGKLLNTRIGVVQAQPETAAC
jgi:integrase